MGRRKPTMLVPTPRNLAVALVLLLAGIAGGYLAGERGPAAGPASAPEPGGAAVAAAFAQRRSDQWLEASGAVVRTLPDDNDGARHQRFILEVAPDLTVLVAHNIDLAPRVPLARGEQVSLRGEYEWNEKGGVIHWTHHDPRGRHRGGWIRHAEKTYR